VTEMAGVGGSLDAKPLAAKTFYATIAATTLAGAALAPIGIDPVRALYWAAVVNGALATPLMALMMLIVRNRQAMGKLTLSPRATVLGWGATAVMGAATLIFFASQLAGGSA
jgi:Mn2+/Fe2+ NRAMP family transporter